MTCLTYATCNYGPTKIQQEDKRGGFCLTLEVPNAIISLH